jgi:transposase
LARRRSARVTDAKLFENGRHLSAWIGIVPENGSTAARSSKRGFPRRATAIWPHFSSPARWPLCARRHEAARRAIAIANKAARIAWAIMVHGGVYEAGHGAAHYRAKACGVTG